ncbi:MAG: hypothetical protein ACE5H0_13470 [Bacteroidota bacterium]
MVRIIGALGALFIILVYGGIIGFALFVVYHLVSAAKTLKEHSKRQTELLREIKGLLEKVANREGSDDVI